MVIVRKYSSYKENLKEITVGSWVKVYKVEWMKKRK